MTGRITSKRPGLNPFGVPYERILLEYKEAHQRQSKAMRAALEKWLRVAERRFGRHVRDLAVLDALESTERALA